MQNYLELVKEQLVLNKPLAIVKKSIKLYIKQENKNKFYADMKAKYNALYPMYRIMTYQEYLEADVEDEPLTEEQYSIVETPFKIEIDYSGVENYLSYNDWLSETKIIQEAIEAEYDEEGNVVVEAVAEVTELVRPYISTEVTDEMIMEELQIMDEYSIYLKKEKKNKLDRLTVTTSTGKVFYADTESRIDLQSAIDGASLKGVESTYWKLAEEFEGQKIVEISLNEIREASALALETKGKLVGAL